MPNRQESYAILESSRKQLRRAISSAFLAICGRHDEEHSELIDRWRKEAGI